ncbi:hypothetical protein PtB15_3B526 [Puccinia triticina]|nr:hypothetical protein PtB15_3B526 [Puccinia triticina]
MPVESVLFTTRTMFMKNLLYIYRPPPSPTSCGRYLQLKGRRDHHRHLQAWRAHVQDRDSRDQAVELVRQKPWIAMKDGLLGKLANMTYAEIVDWLNQPLYVQHQFPSTS